MVAAHYGPSGPGHTTACGTPAIGGPSDRRDIVVRYREHRSTATCIRTAVHDMSHSDGVVGTRPVRRAVRR